MEEILSEIIIRRGAGTPPALDVGEFGLDTTNGESVVGSGDIAVSVSGKALSFKTINGEVITGSGNIDIEEPDVDKNYVDEELAKKQDLIDVDNKLDYSLIDNTPEIPNINEINYNDLVSLRDLNNLKKGAFYRIIDYETTTTQPETRSAGHLFDVIVQALDEKTLSENAQAIHSVRDTDGYFNGVDLGRWELKYSLDNDDDMYYWADTVNGKGVIYRMIDEYSNDLPYDFKNIQFKRYKIETYAIDTSLENRYYALKDDLYEVFIPTNATIDEQDFKFLYTFTVIDENEVVNDVSLNKNKAFTDDEGTYYKTEKNTFGFYNRKEFSEEDELISKSKALGNNVLLYDYREDWDFEGFYDNTIGKNFSDNTIGNCFYGNTIGNDFFANTIDDFFIGNTIDDLFVRNTIRNNFYDNTIGNDFHDNTIGNYFNSNIIGNEIKYITFSVDATVGSRIRYLYLKSGLIGASSENKLDLYFEGLYGRTYPTTFEIIANNNIVSSWEATPLTRAGKVKATNTTVAWTDI